MIPESEKKSERIKDADDAYLRETAIKCAEIGDEMFRLIPAASRDIREFSLLQVRVLQILHNGPVIMKSLASILSMPPSTLSYIVDSLERRGLLERKRISHDRRKVTVHLTTSGIEVMEKLGNFKVNLWMSILKEFVKQEGTSLLDGFTAVHRAIMNFSRTHAPQSDSRKDG